MKRLALLLAAMGIISVGAMAETPKLEVTNVGQEIEIENVNGAQTFDDVWLWNNVGLKYGDWTFGLTAGKQWSVDFDGKGVHSDNARVQIDVWNKINENLKLGTRLRLQDDYDRYYFRWDWADGMFYSAGDSWYAATNSGDKPDSVNLETQVLGIKYNGFAASYYFAYYGNIGALQPTDNDYETEHQVRLFAPLYKGEKLSLSTEARITVASDVKLEDGNLPYKEYDSFGRTRLYLKFDYKVTESLNVYGQYAYEFRDWKHENGMKRSDYSGQQNYQDILVGWRYTF